ncbi:arsenate reductase (glutaredoxin) [Hydrogenovibrio marinus]|uniref:Arsenate reductase n=1 Tax=Hydrogenovibrio marinus TaxID=28885 RepID=A0A066ZS99_HYDMR|nr:arsenate reductase (glutaredoxin) [Hydrogenovibrio marinus]KDN95149.1 arsenate reductase [Hydrogenovibrio marinus]BBN59623.1 arsenate reductase (glutaredoxin) [Hydrogenovibrio marinus]
MKAIIYHNPRCSKSRQTLQLLEDSSVTSDVEVIDYQKTPLDVATLDEICTGLGIEPQQLIRTKEELFKELGLSINDNKTREEWLAILEQTPKLIERPIVKINGRYAIGRPPENVAALLGNMG